MEAPEVDLIKATLKHFIHFETFFGSVFIHSDNRQLDCCDR